MLLADGQKEEDAMAGQFDSAKSDEKVNLDEIKGLGMEG